MNKYNIKIIVEGDEEYTFFDIVRTVGANELFDISIEESTGYGGIADAYLSSLREGMFDCILCVYDVDNKANIKNSPFNITLDKITQIFNDRLVAELVSYCTNPNILQLFLLAADKLDNTRLTSSSKAINSVLVHKYWPKIASGKEDSQNRKIKPLYDAQSWQLDIIKYSIINNDYKYEDLLKNAKELNLDYKNNLPGSNLLPLLVALKNGDVSYFKNISNLVDKSYSSCD